MASIFTTEDRDAVKAALLTAVTNGFASVSVANERMDNQSVDELRKLLDYINNDLSQGTATTGTTAGMVVRLLVPGGCG